MNKNLHIVLMAGGSGTRFWPYSRRDKPKQFLDILGTGKTLIQSTYERFLPLCPKENIFVVTTKQLAGLAKAQLHLEDTQIIVEPIGKNTAPCVAYACYKIEKRFPDAVIVISPSDHLILNEAEFQNTLQQAVESAAHKDQLITLGIHPTRPETGYGYIEFMPSDEPLKEVKNFKEKPNIETAKEFIERGNFVWNSGIFIWHAKAIRLAMEKYQPAIANAFGSISSTFYTPQEEKAVQEVYEKIEPISIDYGVMEKAHNVYVGLSDFAWSDLGSWNSLHTLQKKDQHHNVVDAHALIYDTQNSIIKGAKEKLIVVQGLDGYVVGEFGDVIIVCKKNQESLFRKFITDLKSTTQDQIYL